MKKVCRFCYKEIEGNFYKNIFDNYQNNPSIPKIIETLTSLRIVESDPYTKLSCDNCFYVTILFYHYRESILQTNRLLIDDEIHNKNNNNQNIYNQCPLLVVDAIGRLCLIDIDGLDRSHISSHREGDTANENRNIDENSQDSNKENEQSQENSLHIEKYNEEELSFLKDELELEETCLKIDNDSDVKYQNSDENNLHLNIPAGDGYNEKICSDNRINVDDDDDDSDMQSLHISEDRSDLDEINFIIDIDSNESQELQTAKSFSNKLIDNDNNKIITNSNSDKGKKQLNQCGKCKKPLLIKSNLNNNLKIHSSDKNPQEKKFTSKAGLRRNLSLYTGKSSYECNICNKKFIHLGHLNQHSLTHADETPPLCTYCDRKFSSIEDLKIHLVKHTGRKFKRLKNCSFS